MSTVTQTLLCLNYCILTCFCFDHSQTCVIVFICYSASGLKFCGYNSPAFSLLKRVFCQLQFLRPLLGCLKCSYLLSCRTTCSFEPGLHFYFCMSLYSVFSSHSYTGPALWFKQIEYRRRATHLFYTQL